MGQKLIIEQTRLQEARKIWQSEDMGACRWLFETKLVIWNNIHVSQTFKGFASQIDFVLTLYGW